MTTRVVSVTLGLAGGVTAIAQALAGDPDILVELVGGVELARDAMHHGPRAADDARGRLRGAQGRRGHGGRYEVLRGSRLRRRHRGSGPARPPGHPRSATDRQARRVREHADQPARRRACRDEPGDRRLRQEQARKGIRSGRLGARSRPVPDAGRRRQVSGRRRVHGHVDGRARGRGRHGPRLRQGAFHRPERYACVLRLRARRCHGVSRPLAHRASSRGRHAASGHRRRRRSPTGLPSLLCAESLERVFERRPRRVEHLRPDQSEAPAW